MPHWVNRLLVGGLVCACGASRDAPRARSEAPPSAPDSGTDPSAHSTAEAPFTTATSVRVDPPMDLHLDAGPHDDYASVSGSLHQDVVLRIVHLNRARFRFCYATALRKDNSLSGRVVVHFVIGRDGAVSVADIDPKSTLANAELSACVVSAAKNLSFPQPEGGTVDVVYPMVFTPEHAF